MGDKVQQIIKHRKGCITKVKNTDSYLSEIIYGIGNIGDITGNVVFIGNKDSGSGNYSPISRIYFGINAPTVNAYGDTLNGLPFYSVYDKTLFILNNPKNIDMDLSGNIYRRNIAPNNISASGYISGNSLNITGDVTLGKDDRSIIQITGLIKGSLIPINSDIYDLGTPTNKWRNIYATLISGSFVGDGSNLKNINTSMSIQTIGSSTSTYNISIPSQNLTFYTNVAKGLNLSVGSGRVEIVPFDATYVQKGVSFYNNIDFTVTDGYVSIDYSRNDAYTASINAFTSSIKSYTGSMNVWTGSIQSYTSSMNAYTASLNLYTSSVGNFTKTFNTAANQILVGSSSYSNTLDVNILSNSTINLKLDDNIRVSSSIKTNYLESNTGYFTGSVYVGDFLQLMGNLYVSGAVTTIDSINVNIGDNIIGLNAAGGMLDGGIYVYDNFGSPLTASLLWDVTNNYWKAGISGSEYRMVLQEPNTPLTNKSLVYANSSGRLVSAVVPILNDMPIWDGTTWNNVNLSKFATTSSLGDYTASINAFTASIKSYTGSMNVWTGSIETYTGSMNLYTSSINALTGSYFKQNGNIFGTNAVLGTSDGFGLSFKTNNISRITISTSGNVDLSKNLNIGDSLTINGETTIFGKLNDSSIAAGASNEFLRSTSNGVRWTAPQITDIIGLANYTTSINSYTASINSYTSSINSYTASIKTYTGSMNGWTGSIETYIGFINSFTSSIKSYTSSMNVWTGSIQSYTSSMNDYTSSINALTGSYFKQNGNIFGENAVLGTNDNFSLHFEANNSTRMIVSSSGKIIIGSTVGMTSTALLNVNGDILSTGEISAYSTSDKSLKNNIEKIENSIEILSELNGYKFTWNDKQTLYNNGKKDIGLIAQEVEKILPEIVGTRYDGYKSIKYDRLIAVLIEGFKEMKKEIDYLKTKL